MKYLHGKIWIACMCLLGCKQQAGNQWIQPAEWEPQEAVYMGWDGARQKGDTLHIVAGNIIQTIAALQKLILWTTSDSLLRDAERFLDSMHIPRDSIALQCIPGKKVMWTRDIAPAFIINKAGERMAVDFNHTGYVRYRPRYRAFGFDSARMALALADDLQMMRGDSLMAAVKNEPMLKSWMNIEGGAYDVNGKGSLLVSENFLFRNAAPGMRDTLTHAHFEKEFERTLGVTNVIWLGEGLAEDEGHGVVYDGKYITGGTRGHADEFARFVNPTTIALAWIDEAEADKNSVTKLNYARMRENYQRLLHARDQDGKPFTIVKVPVPDQFYRIRPMDAAAMSANMFQYFSRLGFQPGDSICLLGAGSYLNFLITNHQVIIPSYVQGGTSAAKEAKVRAIFSALFPERELVFLDARLVNFEGGGIHCLTRQVPAVKNIKPAP